MRSTLRGGILLGTGFSPPKADWAGGGKEKDRLWRERKDRLKKRPVPT